MARTAITPTRPTPSGVTAVAEVAGDTVNGNSVTNVGGRTVVIVRNADASNPHSVTFVTSATLGGYAVADQVVSIPASSTREFGNFDSRLFGSTLGIDTDSAELKLQARVV